MMTTGRGLRVLSEAQGVALVGVADGSFYGQLFIKNLLSGGFRGEIAPVHRRGGNVSGYEVYETISAIPYPVDVALLLLRAERCAEAANELADKGCRCLLVMADGFIETGTEEGRRAQEELVEVCDERGMTLIGPNGVGAADYRAGVVCLGVPLPDDVKMGSTSILSHSGALLSGIIEGFVREGVGLDLAVSVGNGAQLGVIELLEALIERDTTEFIAGYVEGFGSDLPRVRRALRRARESGKTVVLVKSGRGELSTAVAASHTASITGSDRLVSAMLSAYGVYRVDDPEEMIRLISVASRLPPNATSGAVALATASGGNAGILADLAEQFGVALADFESKTWEVLRTQVPDSGFVGNPLDVTGRGAAGGLDVRPVYEAVFSDPNVAVILYGFAPPFPDDEPGREAHRVTFRLLADAAKLHGKPLFVPTTTSQRKTPWIESFDHDNPQVSFVEGQQLTLKVLGHLFPTWPISQEEGRPNHAEDGSAPLTYSALSESRGRALLSSAGIPVVRGVELAITDVQDLAGAFDRAVVSLTAPYVLKAAVDGLSHKAAVGGVAVGLTDRAALLSRAKTMIRDVARNCPDLQLEGLLVQEMVRGTELLMGLVRHSDFGPTMTLGLGGALSETIDATATVSLDEVCDDWIEQLLDRAGLSRLVARLDEGGQHGLFEVLDHARVAFMSGALSSLYTVEINPLFLQNGGPPLAGDALVIPSAEESLK